MQRCFLEELNLALNYIGYAGAEIIGQFIGRNPISLKMLNLHWNKIKFKGGLKIAEALQTNTNLKVLDLSWNSLGKVDIPSTS